MVNRLSMCRRRKVHFSKMSSVTVTFQFMTMQVKVKEFVSDEARKDQWGNCSIGKVQYIKNSDQ